MSKTYFIHTFNIRLVLIGLSLITGIISWLLPLFTNHLTAIMLFNTQTIVNTLSKVSIICQIISMLTLIPWFILFIFEILYRLKSDHITNYFKAVYQTFSLRIFLFQKEKSEKISTIENQMVTTTNPINNSFNRSVNRSIIDVRDSEVVVFIKVPRSQQGQKILKEMETQIKEEIFSQNPDYYFSSPNRIKNQLWFTGQKR